MFISAEQLHLYTSLFRGRSDVFAQHWQNEESNRSGYTPVRRKTADGMFEFIPLNDTIIQRHLRGQMRIGIYPLLRDNTTCFLAVDFDAKHQGAAGNWKLHAQKFLTVCAQHGVPAYLERSRSGQGGHVWLFFLDPVPSWKVRKSPLSPQPHNLRVIREMRVPSPLSSYPQSYRSLTQPCRMS